MIRAAIFAGSVLFGGATVGGITPTLVAQSAPSSAVPFDWSSLVGGAIGSSPAALILAWRLTLSDRREKARDERHQQEMQRKDDEIQRLNDKLVDQSREVAGMLERTAGTLRDVEVGLGAELRTRRGRDT